MLRVAIEREVCDTPPQERNSVVNSVASCLSAAPGMIGEVALSPEDSVDAIRIVLAQLGNRSC